MAITYSAGTGAVITSYAMNETLGDQSQQTGNNTVVVSDDIVTAGNGNINTSYYGTYVGRKVLINIGATEQERVVVSQAAGTGNTMILTVHEDWDTNPVSSDTIHVFYTVPDIDTAGGIGYQTKTGIWECSNVVDIGNGTDPAGLHIGDYLAIEFDDRGTSPDLIVNSNARFDIGRKDGGVPSSGGHITFYDNAAGERAVHMNSGTVQFYDAYIWSQLQPLEFRSIATGNVYRFESVKFLNLAYALTLVSNSTFKDLVITGINNTNEDVNITTDAFNVLYDNITFVKLHSVSGSGSAGTRTLKNCSWIACTNDLIIINNDNWVIINPTWPVTSHTDINATAVTGSATVHDARGVDVEIATAAGSPLANANVIIYEGGITDSLVLEAVSDANGLVSDSFDYRLFSWTTGTGSTVTYSLHAFRVDKWLYQPVAASQAIEAREGTTVLLPDPNIVQTTQATAISAGNSTLLTSETNPAELIEFTAGTGTLELGMVFTFTSGATGTFVGLLEGDDTAGTMMIRLRNATAIANGDTFSRTGGTAGTFSATYTNDTKQPFSNLIIDTGGAYSLQTIYDWCAAKSAETTLDSQGTVIHKWGRDEQGRYLIATGTSFYTERSNGKGVGVVGYASGVLDYMTDDNGVTWTPPTSVTVEVHVLDNSTGLDLPLAHVYLIDDATKSEVILSAATNASGIASASYVGTVPKAVTGWVRQNDIIGTDYVPQDISGTITTAGLSLTVRLNPI